MNYKFTFIIHGNYDETHLQMCDELKSFGNIILCTNKKYIIDTTKNAKYYDKIVFDSDIDLSSIYNHQNVYLHTQSVLNGLYHCDTKYVVKLRANHYYSNIGYIVDQTLSNVENKFLCSNVTINPSVPYHVCDTIMAGTTEAISSIFNLAKNSILLEDFIYENLDLRVCSEVLFFISYLKYKKIHLESKDSYYWTYYDYARNNMKLQLLVNQDYCEIIKNNLKIIDVNYLRPFNMKLNTSNINNEFNIKDVHDLLSARNF